MKKLLFIPLLFICSVCYSAPAQLSIDQNLTADPHDAVFVLSSGNSSFGAKATATPQFWDNFEDGAVDTSANYGTWQSVGLLDLTTGNVRHVNSSYSAHENYTSSGTAGMTSNNSILSRKWFVQYWMFLAPNWDWGTDVGNTHLSNVKWLRFWNPGSVNENIYMDYGWSLDNLGKSTCEYITNPGLQNTYFNITKRIFDNGEWNCVQVEFLDSSGANQSDGEYRIWFNGALIKEKTGLVIMEDYTNLKRVSHLGMYNAGSSGADGNDDVNMDDFYMDTTWARVELGTDPVYADCTQREIQIPTAWATDAITFTCNLGSLTTANNVYVFVTDDDGAVSPGLSVSGAGGAAPGEYDTTVPSLGGQSPLSSATGIIQTTDIDFTLSDELSGVNLNWITTSGNMSVSGVDYASSVTATGTKENVSCTLANVATGLFTPGETVTVGVNTKDEAENQKVYEWSFTIEDNTIRWGGETLTLNGETFTLP